MRKYTDIHPKQRIILVKPRGFTTIELLVVMIVVSLLCMMALPAYQSHLMRARRMDGQIALLQWATLMENDFAQHLTYEKALTSEQAKAPIKSPQGFYELVIEDASAEFYQLRAIPTGPQSEDPCGALTYTSQQNKGPNPSSCWA